MRKINDLTGKRFGKLTVEKRTDDYVRPNGQRSIQWQCICDCGNKVIARTDRLQKGGIKSCVNCTWYSELIGRKFGRLTVIGMTNDRSGSQRKALCLCECGNYTKVRLSHLKDGTIKSCGCLIYEAHKKYNTYDLSGEYAVGYTSNTREKFYFDKEDYDLIKDYCWSADKQGYICTYYNGHTKLPFHRYLFFRKEKNKLFIDHINHNTFDNRRCNLRIATPSQNNMNSKIRSQNSSGVTGVDYMKSVNKWRARIKKIHLGTFDNFEDAIKARKEAENKYFGEFSYDNSMKIGNN